MLLGQLGFNPLNVVKSAAKGVYSVASDPRVQQAAAAAAQAYAPEKYAQVSKYADQARGFVRVARGPRQPGMPGMPPRPMMPPPPAMAPMPPMMDEDGMPPAAPVQKGNLMPLMIGGAALVVIVLLLRR